MNQVSGQMRHVSNSKTNTKASYQLPLHVFIARGADEDGVLHEADKAPEGVTFILDLGEQRGHQVRHTLAVAHVGIKHCIVEQNSPGARTTMNILVLSKHLSTKTLTARNA